MEPKVLRRFADNLKDVAPPGRIIPRVLAMTVTCVGVTTAHSSAAKGAQRSIWTSPGAPAEVFVPIYLTDGPDKRTVVQTIQLIIWTMRHST